MTRTETPTSDMASMTEAEAEGGPVYTVARLNHEARGVLESGFPLLWVAGEISNLARPASGHLYFTLKDESAAVRCAMFRGRNRLLKFRPEDGQQILVRAQVSLYPARGDFQLIVEDMEEAGEGALRRAFEDLKRQLAAEGLFADEVKRALPALPRQVGVVTSATGAALRDVLTTLGRRFPGLPVVVYPTAVQGSQAAPQVVAALQAAGRRAECDVLILTRGGGSLEDLWAFNEPEVARAIRACPLPVAVGVGHEVDVTIAGLAADLRAPTPTGAAERVAPDRTVLAQRVADLRRRLRRAMARRVGDRSQAVDHLRRRLVHPGRRLRETRTRLEALSERLHRAHTQTLNRRRQALTDRLHRLHRAGPARRLPRERQRLAEARQHLTGAIDRGLVRRRERLDARLRHLNAVSPLATLERGYAIASKEGTILRRADEVAAGDTLQLRLRRGALACQVLSREEA